MKITIVTLLFHFVGYGFAKPPVIGEFIRENKQIIWKETKCRHGYECPGVWSRDMGDYAEVCFRRETNWLEFVHIQINIHAVEDEVKMKIGKEARNEVTAIYAQFIKMNEKLLKHPTDKLMILFNFYKSSKSATLMTTRIYIPERNMEFWKIPCDKGASNNSKFIDVCKGREKPFKKTHVQRTCFYAIPDGRKSDVYKRLKAENKLKQSGNRLFYTYPIILKHAVHKKPIHYFESSENDLRGQED